MVMRMALDIHKATCQVREDQFCLVIIIIQIQVNVRMEFLKYIPWEYSPFNYLSLMQNHFFWNSHFY